MSHSGYVGLEKNRAHPDPGGKNRAARMPTSGLDPLDFQICRSSVSEYIILFLIIYSIMKLRSLNIIQAAT